MQPRFFGKWNQNSLMRSQYMLEPWVRASQYMLILKEKVWLRQIALLGMPWLICIQNVLVDLYAKCGEARESWIIFKCFE